ncbi:ribosome assembly RNA-binding protein YhbY [Geoalkalibacter halelectricus]|uniref:Ribosome assembly RNA-binding protein YhbY n=1 Tax=Geoalkalibacter halelectricus TaxID=2847045 RepID=A0ABY5ZRB2_9BACT|nr:ribosome assembly RNA-binding protein YhbY [Geoalkalibacter halelectricus]MDO3379991.1 ribosome assembly RNA-binding protein YhbY [Geoalkalibacter halelectricus]UWZ80482.1 ribosome assembly RNA-binding protein YhbY [Geoalkalibacter halelectricus]
MQKLTGKQARHLRALGHHLNPTVMVGKDEIDERLLQALDAVLEAHELVKVKIQKGCLLDRKEVAEELARRSGAAVAQVLGQTILLYRPSEKQRITLPAATSKSAAKKG